jgi:hypothetical protein
MAPAIHDHGLGILAPMLQVSVTGFQKAGFHLRFFLFVFYFLASGAFSRMIYNSFSTFVLYCCFFSK